MSGFNLTTGLLNCQSINASTIAVTGAGGYHQIGLYNTNGVSYYGGVPPQNGVSTLALGSNYSGNGPGATGGSGLAEIDYVCVSGGSPGGHHFFKCVFGTNTLTLAEIKCGAVYATAYNSSSDKRIKRDILSIGSTLENMLKMNPVTFNYNFDSSDCPVRSGFIAQEVEELFPLCVSDSDYDNTIRDNVKCLSIVELIPYIVKSVQEQNALVVSQQSQITDLQTTVASQQSQIDSLTQQLADLKALVQTLLPNP